MFFLLADTFGFRMKVSFLLYSIITLVSSHIVMAYNVYLMLLTLLWPTRTTFESPTTETAAVSPSPVTRMAQVWGVAVWCSRPARATCTSLQCSEDTAATTTRLMPQLLLLQSRLPLLQLLQTTGTPDPPEPKDRRIAGRGLPVRYLKVNVQHL